jgi:ATP-dependent DNA helicase 2 subunit 2
MIEYEFPQYYNDFLRDLKDEIINSQLGDDSKTDFWYESFRGSKLGLIDQEALDISDVTEEEAKAFMRLNSTSLPTRGK